MPTLPPRDHAGAGPAPSTPVATQEPTTPWVVRLILPALFSILMILILRRVVRIDGLESLWKIAKVLLGLGFVIFIHELGHFLLAKWCDVHVQTFSVGFGPALPGCSFQWGETLYKIALFPLGGYVKMIGEGAEEDDNADDPRSFKKKSVGQRMAIISAGVVMNVILAGVCFSLVYQLHGVKRAPAEIASVEAGSPAWEKGIPSGALIDRIDQIDHPYFDDLLPKVMHSQAGENLTLVYETRSQPPKTVEIEPRRRKGDDQPLIGVRQPDQLELVEKKVRQTGLPPVLVESAADHATPSFGFGDEIIATTDPDHPSEIKELPPNPFAPQLKDCHEFYQRLVQLEGKEMVIQVRRAGAAPQTPPVNIRVPASYHFTFGMRMRMGQITAIRDGSMAAAKEAELRAKKESLEGDIINEVEVAEADGHKTRFVTARSEPDPAAANDNVKVVEIDPMRLPYELKQWAGRQKGPKTLALTVLHGVGRKRLRFELPWDESWRFNREMQFTPSDPLSIPELGLAYRVECKIEAVEPNSPAAKAGLKEGEVIEAVRYREWDAVQKQTVPGSQWYELEMDQWAWSFAAVQRDDFKQVTFRVKRDNQPVEITVAAQPDETWPLAERGLLLMPDLRLQKANGLGSAIVLGFERTGNMIVQTLQQVRAMLTRRVSATKTLHGPISISVFAYHFAGEGFFEFLNFLGIISVSLAVINFLPIPLLDGGHMAFLIYEKVRGRPAPEQVQVFLMYLGLLIILSLMFFAFYVDWRHWDILKFLFGK
ncbi:MAG TPA: site-2 protease family protein [Gemmataceae bacterium]|nr:site-2 protease family protein [Gemmataceae bacterium]